MKKIALILISPNIPVPPKGWGAIEKYIWEYKINLEKLGHQVELRYPNAPDLVDFDIVQVHTWNQALALSKRNIPYIFSFDDTHAVYHGKTSNLFKGNLEAIQKSKLTIVHSEYLIDFFGEKNIVYLRHGANPEVFYKTPKDFTSHNLLCVGRTDQDDRKGLLLSIEVAKELDLPLTIVGPNEEFFKKNPPNYDKLTLVGNTDDEGLNKLYNSHSIFLHPSKLETGHPNLTLVESIYCNTPVVGTCNVFLPGMEQIEPTKKDLIRGIKKVINNYDSYIEGCIKLQNTKKYDWNTITRELYSLYEKNDTMKEILIKEYASTIQLNHSPLLSLVPFKFSFIEGPKCTVKDTLLDNYEIIFKNSSTDRIHYTSTIQSNMWAKCNLEYNIPWEIEIKNPSTNETLHIEKLNLENQKVYISFDSKAIGDTIAWIPYVEEFRKTYHCEVVCSTFHNDWFATVYPNISFVPPGAGIPGVYAKFRIGWFYKGNDIDFSLNPSTPLSLPLQQTATDILGLPYKEIKPKISFKTSKPPIEEPYVTLSMQSTCQAKYWNYIGGWQQVVDFLNSQGYKVVCVDRYPVFGKGECLNRIPLNVIDKTGCSVDEIVPYIAGAKFHLGISSGLSWLSWALGTHVVMVSSFTKPLCEFTTNCTRIFNDNESSGYFNDPQYKFNPGDWNWNPLLKTSTPEEWHNFESITPEQVINEINKLL